MADKKVERSGRERPITPTQKMEASLSDPGTMNMAEAVHDKGRSALVDRFREREEKWRREQALHAQQTEPGLEVVEVAVEPGEDEVVDRLLRSAPRDETRPTNKEGGARGGAL
jgi:hypothetical protein